MVAAISRNRVRHRHQFESFSSTRLSPQFEQMGLDIRFNRSLNPLAVFITLRRQFSHFASSKSHIGIIRMMKGTKTIRNGGLNIRARIPTIIHVIELAKASLAINISPLWVVSAISRKRTSGFRSLFFRRDLEINPGSRRHEIRSTRLGLLCGQHSDSARRIGAGLDWSACFPKKKCENGERRGC